MAAAPHSRAYPVLLIGAIALFLALPGCGHKNLVVSSGQDLVVMDDEGGNVMTIRSDAHSNSTPSWSPSGNQLAFSDVVTVNGCCNHLDIFITSSSGTGRSNLTTNCPVGPVGDCNEFNSDWHSNGIVFELEAMSTDLVGPGEIFVMDANGSNKTNLTDHVADDVEPAWSPDGDQIAFSSDRSGNYEIYVMDFPGGGNVRQVTNNAAEDRSPSWGRATVNGQAGEWIAFVSDRDGDREIFMIQPDGSGLRQETDNTADDWSPSWDQESIQTFVFLSDRSGSDEVYLGLVGGAVKQLTSSGVDKHTVDYGQ